ncbi:mitochondrion organization and biogenesis protein [Colletotrichum scovillei]|uniref:Mitochondrion organization and biogenesis protein n=1 Tax=Colletotrichum scovillei TaxID=1209932 RepID=A0A9P7RAM4_9PEZI|nr:mitochondrion organization and biogenesis protein [Colletotrichum scovillei]KAG7072301.1 mitochondrion organization and biogenesis protein [Colletotrichum scovillei]
MGEAVAAELFELDERKDITYTHKLAMREVVRRKPPPPEAFELAVRFSQFLSKIRGV